MRLGERLGRKLRGGEVIELISDLGGGKTTFVRGLARGLGTKDPVASPSFTISRSYAAGRLRLDHYDFYRLNDAGVVRYELAESLSDPKVVVVVEWPNVIEDVLPADRLRITIDATGDETRTLSFKAGSKHQHLLKNLA